MTGRAQRRFAWRARLRWLAGWKWFVAATAAIAVCAGAVWVVFYSTLLSLSTVEVVGAKHVSDRQIVHVAAVRSGQPLARVDLEAVARRVSSVPVVRRVTATRQWPHTLVLTVTERRPVARVAGAKAQRAVDASGATFALPSRQLRRLPAVVVGPSADGGVLAEAARVASSLPRQLLSRVGEIRAKTKDSITLRLRSGNEVQWGSADQSDRKARVLAVLLRRRASVYDVSVPEQPTTAGG